MYKRTLVTAALPYANGPIHLGHLAGAYLPSDFFVRYRRLNHDDILYVCGSDEHGVAITIKAEKEGITPQEVVDKYHHINKKAFEHFSISFDFYGRTSSPVHHETSQEFFTSLHEQGIFKEKTEEQLFDQEASMFLPDRYVKGTCPVCGYEEAYGDQCEKCGSSLSPTELINPVSAITGNIPVLKKTTHWYLPLGDFQPFINEWIASKKNWKPNVTGQISSWLNAGLQDRAITRDLDWGVKVPLPHTEGKVLYVWLDAPIGYISATKEWALKQEKPDLWKKYWQDEETQLLHFIGKDNIVFHCLMFPSILKAKGDYVLPDNVPSNEFLNLEGKKFSTSRGWAVWLDDYLENFEPDLLRYALGTILPETKDADFSWKDFQAKVNNELADILGNFLFRTESFLTRYFDKTVPSSGSLTSLDTEALEFLASRKEIIGEKYEHFKFREAISETMSIARYGNKYFTEKEPWKTRKTDPQSCANTLFVCAQFVATLCIAFDPIIPKKMAQLRTNWELSDPDWSRMGEVTVPSGHEIKQTSILFTKIEDEAIQKQLDTLMESVESQAKSSISYEPLKPAIDFDDFQKLDLRVGTITECEPLKKSKKLYKLTIDLGFETRTILSGIKQHFEIDSLINKKVIVVANLKPRKMMGIESNGMVLMAEDDSKALYLLTTDGPNGSLIS